MLYRILLITTIFIIHPLILFSQNHREQYDSFKESVIDKYKSFREDCNLKYADFLRTSWKRYEGKAPIPMPKDESPVPPKPYIGENDIPHIDTKPEEIDPIDISPQPKPIEPIKEIPTPDEDYFTLKFYG